MQVILIQNIPKMWIHIKYRFKTFIEGKDYMQY